MTKTLGMRLENMGRYLTQKEIAKRLGVNKGTLWRWKTGYMRPTTTHLRKITHMDAGLRVKGHLRPIYHKSGMASGLPLRIDRKEHTYPHKDKIAGDLSTKAGKAKTIDALREMFKQIEYNQAFRKYFKSIFLWFNSKSNRKGQMNALNLVSTFDYQFFRGDEDYEGFDEAMPSMFRGDEDYEGFDEAMPSMAIVEGTYSNKEWSQCLEDLMDDLINAFRKWLNYPKWEYVVFEFKKTGIVSWKYFDIKTKKR